MRALSFEPRVPSPDGVHNFRHLTRTEHGIDLRNLRLELLAIALGETAGHDQPRAAAVLLVLGHFENGVDRFLLRLVDERARIDHKDVSRFGVAGELVTRLLRKPQHHLGINEVFGTAKRNHSNLHA